MPATARFAARSWVHVSVLLLALVGVWVDRAYAVQAAPFASRDVNSSPSDVRLTAPPIANCDPEVGAGRSNVTDVAVPTGEAEPTADATPDDLIATGHHDLWWTWFLLGASGTQALTHPRSVSVSVPPPR